MTKQHLLRRKRWWPKSRFNCEKTGSRCKLAIYPHYPLRMTGCGKSLIKHCGTFQFEWQKSGVASGSNRKPKTVRNSLNRLEKIDWLWMWQTKGLSNHLSRFPLNESPLSKHLWALGLRWIWKINPTVLGIILYCEWGYQSQAVGQQGKYLSTHYILHKALDYLRAITVKSGVIVQKYPFLMIFFKKKKPTKFRLPKPLKYFSHFFIPGTPFFC